MPKRRPSSHLPTDDWVQLRLLCAEPAQEAYELLRPIVLFGRSATRRAKETGRSARTIARNAQTFVARGMASLFTMAPSKPTRSRTFPEEIRQAIRTLKAEHPAFRVNELATICFVRFDRRPDAKTIRRILDEGPLPIVLGRRFPRYPEIVDPVERRLAIVHLHAEGWNIQSIAAYLQTTRPTVYATLHRWIDEGVIGPEEKPHTRKKVALKTTLKATPTEDAAAGG